MNFVNLGIDSVTHLFHFPSAAWINGCRAYIRNSNYGGRCLGNPLRLRLWVQTV